MDFAAGLQQQLEDRPNKRVQGILDDTNKRRRFRRLQRMERHARAHLNVGEDAPIDWGSSSIDWKSLIDLLVKLLPLLLAIL